MNKSCETKDSLDRLLYKYRAQPVGWGYIDCITMKQDALDLINSLTALGVNVSELTWWCHCQINGDKVNGCPHGGGGPRSKYYSGYFSEMYQIPNMRFSMNDDVVRFILEEWPSHKEYLPCLVPALWLDVPNDWKNTVDV